MEPQKLTIYDIFDRDLYRLGSVGYNSNTDSVDMFGSGTGIAITSTSTIPPENVGSGTSTNTIQQTNGNISAIKTSFSDNDPGYILGFDTDGVAKFLIGNATNSLYWNGTSLVIIGDITATTGTIGGFVIGATTVTSTGLTLASGTTAYLSFGTIPPISPTIGTGIYIDKTGLFGLNANTQNFKIDATNGNITAIAGTIGGFTLGATSLSITVDGNTVTISSGEIAFLAGPTGSPGTSISQDGTLSCISGNIGGFIITDYCIRDSANSFGLAPTVTAGDDVRFWAGSTFANRATAPFRVTEAGVITSTSGVIANWTISTTALSTGAFQANGTMYFGTSGISLSDVFSVTSAGVLFATSGAIGGFTLGSTTLYAGVVATRIQLDTTTGIHLGATAFADAPFKVSLAGALTATNATITGSITATTGAIGGFTIGATTISSTGLLLTSGDPAFLSFGNTPPTLPSAGTGIYLDRTGLFGLNANTQNFKIDATNGSITAIAGTIGGWEMTSTLLRSASSGARIELDDANGRISIFDATDISKVVMGYLNGLPKNDGSGNWGVSDYGFWARSGNQLSIDGGGEYTSGDWLIQNDAAYLIKDDSNNTIIRLGTDTGEKGLFIYNTAGVQLAKFISTATYIGSSASYLQYTVAGGLSLYANIADALTLDYGSNALLKEGGSINFTYIANGSACTATLIETAVGNVDNGVHLYKITYVSATGETSLGASSNQITVDNTHKQVQLSNISISSSSAVVARKIYRSKVSGTNDLYLLATINDNSTTIYTDNTADANLTGDYAYERENDSFGKILINSVESLTLGAGNTFVGRYAGSSMTTGFKNTVVGARALEHATYCSYSVAVGYYALHNNTTGHGTAIGYNALTSSTTGSGNVAIGNLALESYNHLTTVGCVAIGASALKSNVSGDYNTAVGTSVLMNNTGNGNTGVGKSVLQTSTSADYNTAMGYGSLFAVTTGDNNVAVGYYSGYSLTTGGTNTFLGTSAGNNASQLVSAVNSTALGYNTYTTTDNQVVIGNTSITETLLQGNCKIGGTAVRSDTAGTKQLVIFDGTAPVGTLANGCSFYSTAGEMWVMDAAGTPTQLSPHNKDGQWIYNSVSGKGKKKKRIKIDMEKMMRFLNDKFGTDFVHEYEI